MEEIITFAATIGKEERWEAAAGENLVEREPPIHRACVHTFEIFCCQKVTIFRSVSDFNFRRWLSL